MSPALSTWMAFGIALLLGPQVLAQVPPEPGPEHKRLKELEGTWDVTMKMGTEDAKDAKDARDAKDAKGVMTYKMDLGGLWLVGEFQSEFGGQKFSGKGLDSYDPIKKKYVGVWCDSMSTSPMVTEGNFDKDGKVLTMTGEGPGMDGKPMKFKMTSEHKDKDTFLFTMYGIGLDGKETEMFSMTYKRRK